MAKGKLLITRYNEALLSILTDPQGNAVSINAETGYKNSIVGNIYACNVTDVVRGINGAFAEYEKGKKGFFHLEKKPCGGGSAPIFLNRNTNGDQLRQGDIILLQVKADSVKQKEPLFSSDISIPGKYSVLVANDPGIRFSSRIRDAGFKERFMEAFSGRGISENNAPGFIIRTAAAEADMAWIIREIDMLTKNWSQVMGNAANTKKGLVFKNLESYLSDIMENFSSIDKIVTDDPECAGRIRSFLEEKYPEDIDKFEILNSLKAPLKTLYGVEHMLDSALNKIVWLKSGAFLVVEPTEALTVIDVNSGSASGKDFFDINLEAAREAARQMRLRNLSGMILIDFISMSSQEDKRNLLKAMRAYMETDPLKPAAVDITKLGLMEITRKKVRRPLYETMDFC